MSRLAPLVGFSRPHTIIATSIQVLTMFLIAGGWRAAAPGSLVTLALTLGSCLALNLYVVGLNQITDVAIDRVNKPELPLAAGRLSPGAARRITAGAGLLALALAAVGGRYLLLTVGVVMLIGTAYSLPPLRLKGQPVAAALSIALARGVLATAGIALHYHDVLGGAFPASTVAMLGLFFFGFGLVIAIYKDIPDLAGDRAHQVQTLTVRLGPRRALALGRLLLTICYALPVLYGLISLPSAAALFLLLSHLVAIGLFWAVSVGVNPERRASVAGLYMFLWRMFYAEFALLSVYELARVTA